MSQTPTFTRYLYEVDLVKQSLELSLIDKNREESLFWAFELYYSGFQEEIWQFIMRLYETHYQKYHMQFKTRLDSIYAEWKETGNACLLGTVVGTLAVWEVGKVIEKRQFIILYRDTRHITHPVTMPTRHYLKQVSQFAIRLYDTNISENIREAYLGKDWLYYCSKTPIWEERIRAFNGIVDDEKKCVEFADDDSLESFYENWGFEPDEQPVEIHAMHGVFI